MDNTRGAMLMVLAMFLFAVEDMFIKQMAGAIPVGQIVAALALGGALFFLATEWIRGSGPIFDRYWHPAVIGRNLCDAFGTIGFVTAIALIPISTASAVLQATPLAVTIGAALFLGETVGWRRWTATLLGLGGVVLIIRPGLEGFDANVLFAVMGVVGLGARDLFTRKLPRDLSSSKVSIYAFVTLIPTGVAMFLVQGDPVVVPDTVNALRFAAATVIGIAAYYAIVMATRIGDVSMVSPFRYSRLVFAMIIGIVAFGERPDALTLLGAAIVVGSGLYSLLRERRLRRASLAEQPLL